MVYPSFLPLIIWPLIHTRLLRDCAVVGPVKNSSIGRTMGCADPSSGFINLRETETDRQQLVLLAYGPGTREGESFPQSQHSFKPPDCSSCCMEGLKAADSRHVLFGPEDPLGVWLATCAPGE